MRGKGRALGALLTALICVPGVVSADVEGGPHPFHGQEIDWRPCLSPQERAEAVPTEGDPDWLRRLECGTVTVPLDHGDPQGRTLDLAVIRHPAQGVRQGSLVIDFGGPGVSGTDTFLSGPLPLGRGVRAGFDMVSFDPRGVGASGGFVCPLWRYMERPLEWVRDTDPQDVAGDRLEALEKTARALAQSCVEEVGEDFLANMGTVNVVRDLDILRDALGDERLDYLGYSYGTSIGALYAQMYPERTGALVLDGAVPLEDDVVTRAVEQTGGLQTSWEAFVVHCLDGAPECPFTGIEEATEEVEKILVDIDAEPLRVNEETVDRHEFLDLLRGSLHTEQLWPNNVLLLARLAEGERDDFVHDYLAALKRTRPEEVLGAERSAHLAVRCADHIDPTDPSAYQEGARRASQASPLFGGHEVWRMLPCAFWPDTEVMPTGITAPTAPPILVIGTLGDPATPYAWARELSEQLTSATLLTYEGGGHTAYAAGRPCVDEVVDTYLLSGVPPAPDATCRSRL